MPSSIIIGQIFFVNGGADRVNFSHLRLILHGKKHDASMTLLVAENVAFMPMLIRPVRSTLATAITLCLPAPFAPGQPLRRWHTLHRYQKQHVLLT